jgi:hypothetical protein
MTERFDYSGDFDPTVSYDDFNKETLLKLLAVYGKYLLRIDGFWYLEVMKKCGNDNAFHCDLKVWEKLQPWEVKVFSELMGIQGDNVASVMKYFQVCPWVWALDYDIELKNPDYGIITMTRCPTLRSLEKEGAGREKLICQEVEPKIMGLIAHHFNPEIKVSAIKVPPRTDYSDCCCQWEFKL